MFDSVLSALHARSPQLPALDDGMQRLTYGELSECVSQEQYWLTASGVNRCALLAANGGPWIIADLALMSSGALHVPLPGNFTTSQRLHILDDGGIGFVLTDQPEKFEFEHPEFSRVGRSDHTGLTLMYRESAALVQSMSPDVIKVTYTSGSTGTPKGVCLSGRAINAVAHSLACATSALALTRHLCLLPLTTLLESIAGIYAPLLLGAQIITRPAASLGTRFGELDVPDLLRSLDAIAPDSLVLVPELLRLLVLACSGGWNAPQSLKFVAVGGATVSAELLSQAHRWGLPVYEGYGLSECASVVCLNTPEACRPGSVGKPLPHARVRIDSSGEICVGGATMSGYLGDCRESLNEIRTGDLGEIDDDGFVYVRGRKKNLFITGMGRNIAPEWVERELTCEPAISLAMVIGEAHPFPVAMIAAPDSVTATSIDSAVASANARLPDYARVRRWVRFPYPPSLRNGLLTANGRLRRDAILGRHGALVAALYDVAESYADVIP